MLKHSHDGAQSAQMKWGPDSSHGSGTAATLSPWTKAPSHCRDKTVASSAFMEVEEGGKQRFVSSDSSVFSYPFQSVDLCYDGFVSAPGFASNNADNTPQIFTDTNLAFPGKLPCCVHPAQSSIGPCQSLHAIHQEDCTVAVVDAPPDPPRHESAAADGPRNGAKFKNEAGQLRAYDTASAAARHPIIAKHWGIAP